MKLIKIPSLKKREYIDADYLMMHACFSIHAHYIERERGGRENFAAYLSEFKEEIKDQPKSQCKNRFEHYRVERAALRLYDWWQAKFINKDRPKDFPSSMHDEISILRREYVLFIIRHSLWT